MAVGPYDQLQPTNFRFLKHSPGVFAPDIGELDTTLEQLQTYYDTTTSALSSVMPKHIEEDDELAKSYAASLQAKIEDIQNSYMENGISAGQIAQSQALHWLEKDMKAGDYAAFEMRVKEKEAEKERIRETHKDNPTLANYLIAKVEAEPFKKEDGTYGHVKLSVPVYRDVPIEDIKESIEKTASLIKAEALNNLPEKRRLALEGNVSVYELLNTEGIDLNRALQILSRSIPDDYFTSLQQMHKARMFLQGVPEDEIDPTDATKLFVKTKDEKTGEEKVVFNQASELGRLIAATAGAVAHTKPDRQYIKVGASDRGDGDPDSPFNPSNISTAYFKNNLQGDRMELSDSGSYKSGDYDVDGKEISVYNDSEKGKFNITVTTGSDDPDFDPENENKSIGFLAGLFNPNTKSRVKEGEEGKEPVRKVSYTKKVGIDEYFTSYEEIAKDRNPYEYQAYQILSASDEFVGYSDELKQEMLERMGDEIYNNYSQLRVQFTPYSTEEREEMVKLLVGDRPTASSGKQTEPSGLIYGRTIYVLDDKNGLQPMSYATFKDEFDVNDIDVQKRLQLLGETVDDDVSIMASGISAIWTDASATDKGKSVYLVISDLDEEKANLLKPLYDIALPLINPNALRKNNIVPSLGITAYDMYAPNGYASTAENVTSLSVLEDQLSNYNKMLVSATRKEQKQAIQENIRSLRSQISDLKKSPAAIQYITSKLRIYDPVSGEPIQVFDPSTNQMVELTDEMILETFRQGLGG